MVEPVIPSLTERRADLIGQIVLDSEIKNLYDRYAEVMHAYLAGIPVELTPDKVAMPPAADKLDAAIKSALVSLAKSGVRSALKKLCWTAYVVFDPDYSVDWSDPKYALAATVHTRLHQTDFYLSEYRDLQANEGKDWHVTVKGPSGVLRKLRTFPMWGVEHTHGLDNYQRALAWYRKELMDRGIVSA